MLWTWAAITHWISAAPETGAEMIAIKDVEMPSCCDECFALDDNGDYPMCRITHDQRGYTFNVLNKRMDSCPLVESLVDKIVVIK